MRRITCALALLVGSVACSPGGGGAVDGGVHDAVFEVSLQVPDGCPPPDGNEKGVGAPCTMNGGQCKGGLRCTCDPALGALLVGVPCFCTLAQLAQNGSVEPCKDAVPATYCGSTATCCNYLNSAAYCVPNICLPGNQCLVFTTDAGP
jgi:hypothetical protein